MRRVHAIISGRVQGVGYRASVSAEARRLGLCGWVRNRSDGAVELEAEGPPVAVGALLVWCADGPPSAHIINVAAEDIPATGADRSFAIR
jgi:acylphosphatase